MAITLDKFFELGEHAEGMSPTALSEYQKFIDDLNQIVPLSTITDEDVKRLLSDIDNWIYLDWLKVLQEWLTKCLVSNSNTTPPVYPGELSSWSKWWIKRLLKKVGSIKHGELVLLAAQKEIEEQIRLAKIEEQAQRKQAQLEHDQYLYKLSFEVEKFKAELGKSKKPKLAYPLELKKYEPDSWCELDLPSKEQIQNWAERKILEVLPEILADLTRWELTREVRVMPRASYEVEAGIPCLTWYFESHILVTASLELKKYVIRRRYPAGYAVEVQGEGEKLGVLYLEQPEWLTPGIFTTPIALLSLLAKGDLEAPGITVTEHDYLFTTFVIQGFEEEVEIYDGFRKFIKDVGNKGPLAQGLLAMGLVDKVTANLVEEKGKLPLPPVSGSEASGKEGSDEVDLVAALEALGYKKEEIKKMVDATPLSPNMPLEEKVEAVLKFLDGNSL